MKSNADKIKRLSIVELALLFSDLSSCYKCPAKRSGCVMSKSACFDAWFDYLVSKSDANVCDFTADRSYLGFKNGNNRKILPRLKNSLKRILIEIRGMF